MPHNRKAYYAVEFILIKLILCKDIENDLII